MPRRSKERFERVSKSLLSSGLKYQNSNSWDESLSDRPLSVLPKSSEISKCDSILALIKCL